MRQKIICISGCVMLLVFFLLNILDINLYVSSIILLCNVIIMIWYSIFLNQKYDTFHETELHRIFLPQLQMIISVCLVILDLFSYSNVLRKLVRIDFSAYDFIAYISLMVIGCSLYASTKMKKIIHTHVFYYLVIPFFSFVVISFATYEHIKISIVLVFFYVVYQSVMSDKNSFTKIRNNFRKYH